MAASVEMSMKEWNNQEMSHQVVCTYLPQEHNSPCFELKASFIRLLPKFHGWEHEDPHQHVREFILMCSSMRSSRIPEEAVLKRAFPMSLQGAARDWFIYQHQPFGNWQEMQQRFLNKFFPSTKVASIRREITAIAQFQEEDLDEYWKRFNMLCTTCPNHQIPEHMLLVYFYEGLLFEERMFVDAAAGGSLLNKSPIEAKKLLCKLAGENPIEVAKGESEQVYSELEIPIHLSEVQVNFDAFELLKPETIKPVLDFAIDMPMHTHVLDSLYSIEHLDISTVVHKLCTDLDCVEYNNLDDAAANLKIGKIILNEPTQVSSELETLVVLPDLPMHLNAFDLLHIDCIEFMTETDAVLYDHSKFLDSVLAIEAVDLNAAILDLTMNIDDCLDMNELLHDSSLELSLDSAVDSHVSADFYIETVETEDILVLGLSFDLTQFSEDFKCGCESGSCSICVEINDVIQLNSKPITDANCEFDGPISEMNDKAGAKVNKESMVDEKDCIATALSKPEVFTPVPNTQGF